MDNIFGIAFLLIGLLGLSTAVYLKQRRRRKKPTVVYVLHPGEIRSINDGDWHYISSGELARLYGLKHGTWISYNTKTSYYPSHLIHLYPLTEGNYREFIKQFTHAMPRRKGYCLKTNK